jgi:endonuclease/exonuclease/phosphatase family metal-dependent hydrolase
MKLSLRSFFVLSILISFSVVSCKTSFRYSYEQEDSPKFSEDHRNKETAGKEASILKVVSFNIEFSKEVSAATDLLQNGELAEADIILLQEMDEHGVEEIARALELQYIYYPSSNHPKEKTNLGNAVLTSGNIIKTEKILLPYPSSYPKPFQFKNYLFRKTATVAHILIKGKTIIAASTHAPAVLPTPKRKIFAQELLQELETESDAFVVVGGDFNTFGAADMEATVIPFTEKSYTWATKKIGCTVSKVKPILNGLPKSLFQLDHIFVKNLHVLNFGKIDQIGVSDHLPIWIEIRF